jgi:hypothetical protein
MGIAKGYAQDDPGSILGSVQTGSKAHPPPFNVYREISPGWVKRLGREADHSPPPSIEVKSEATPTLLHTSSWHGESREFDSR